MTEDQATRLEDKLDQLLELKPALLALGELLVEADFITKAKGLNPKTISKNRTLDKYQGFGQRKLLVKVSALNVIKQRKRPK